MAAPTTKQELIDYCKRKLGAPVIEINVDDDQVDDRIDEAIQYFNEFHYDGAMRTFLKVQLSAALKTTMQTDEDTVVGSNTWKEQNNYIELPEYVMSVMKVYPLLDKGSVNMFDLRYQIRLNDVPSLTSSSILYYSQVKQYVSLIDQVLVGQPPIRYNTHKDRLYLDMDLDSVGDDEYILLECYRKMDPTDFTDVYDDMWLKKYATALIKQQWGDNMSKFQGIALPGGITLDAQTIKTEATEEIRRLEEESRTTFEMPPFDMIG